MTTVVIAEDEAIIRLDIKETLESEGYEVVGDTGRGDHVLDLVAEHQPDVVIVDIKMPGLDGLEVAKRISDLHDAAVVVLTAFSQRDLIDRAVKAGVLGYLVKPFQKSDLIPAVEVACARHREIKEITGKAQTLTERLEARKVIDKAKSFLMNQKGLSEDDAFRFIQTTAMDGRESMLEVSKKILGQGFESDVV
ncbi:MAG TPA: response regulator [Acidimicrobiales bacterium]|nr:response regulator [Acidimicrobiales bacterium]